MSEDFFISAAQIGSRRKQTALFWWKCTFWQCRVKPSRTDLQSLSSDETLLLSETDNPISTTASLLMVSFKFSVDTDKKREVSNV